jgi:formate hydrogenlyase subunit 3/multisubunit Na+/H+ antiporter MnhD subunit
MAKPMICGRCFAENETKAVATTLGVVLGLPFVIYVLSLFLFPVRETLGSTKLVRLIRIELGLHLDTISGFLFLTTLAAAIAALIFGRRYKCRKCGSPDLAVTDSVQGEDVLARKRRQTAPR